MPPYGDEPASERPPRANDPPPSAGGARERTPPYRYVWQSVVERIVGYFDPRLPEPEVPRKLQPAVKFIAVVMSNKGDLQTGRHCTVGIPRLTVLTGYDERTCREALGILRYLGLLVRTRRGYANEHTSVPDEHKLALPDDILERVILVDPGALTLPTGLVLQGAPSRRKKPKSAPPDDQATTELPGVTPATTEPAPAAATGHDTRDHTGATGHDTRDQEPVPGVAPVVPGVTPTYHDRTHDRIDPHDITHSQSETHAARAPEADEDPNRLPVSPLAGARAGRARGPDQPPPERCGHGLPAGRRADGRIACPMCHRDLPASTTLDQLTDLDADRARARAAANRIAPVIPIRRNRGQTA